MGWFKQYFNKYAYSWMGMFQDGRRGWQVSLDEAMGHGRGSWGDLWEGNEYADEIEDKYAAKKSAFYEWVDKVPGSIILTLKSQIDDHLERTEGFRPFETESTNDSIETPSIEELDSQWS